MNSGWKLRTLLTSFFVSASGDWAFLFASIWVFTKHSGSQQEAGSILMLLGVFQGFASLILSGCAPYALNRTAKTHLLIRLTFILALISMSIASVQALGWPIGFLFTLATLKSGVSAMYLTVDGAFISDLFPEPVRRDGLNRLRHCLVHVARVVVFSFAGFLLVWLGPSPLFFWDGLSFCIMALVIWLFGNHTLPSDERKSFFELWRAGLSYVSHHPAYGRLLLIAALITFLGTMNFTLTPVLTSKERGWNEVSLAWIYGAGGIGGMIGTTTWWSRRMLRRGVMLPLAAFCLTSLILPFAPNRWLAGLAYFFIVLVNTPLFVQFNSVFQAADKRDAVLALNTMLGFFLVPILRMVFVEVCQDQLGLVTSQTMSLGCVCVLGVGILVIYVPHRKELKEVFCRHL